jgi:hypothetical protein
MQTVLKVTVLVIVIAAGVMYGCGSKPAAKAEAVPAVSQQAVVYTCPMHPEVTSDKPGKCPKCGMDLVVKK